MPAVMIAPNGQAHEVSDEHIESARSEGYEPAARFTRNGQQVVIPATDFDAAFKEGLQPVDKKEMGIWEAFKTGVSAGMQPASELAAGMTGFPFVPPEQETQTELEKSQAWEEHPIAYGLGKAIPTVGAIGAGAIAARGAQKAGGAAIAATRPMIQPSIAAGRDSFKNTMANPAIPDILGVSKPIVAGASAIRGAIKQVPETRREIADLARLEQASPNPESGSINPRNQRLFLGQELLDAGMTPEKQALAERAVTFAPSRIRTEPLTKALEMGTTRRSQGRNFLAEQAAEEITPELKQTFGYLQKGKGEAYGKLFGQAQTEYNPESGIDIPSKLASRLNMLRGVQEITTENPEATPAKPIMGITGPTISTLEAAKQMVDEGPAPYGLTPGPFSEAQPADQYKRLKVAREFLGTQIRQMKGNKDPNISNRASLTQLEEAKAELDDVMKSIPSQAKADQLYTEAMKAKGAFYDAMEFGKGMQKKIDTPTVKKLFGNNDKAYRLREGIDTMRQFLDKFGDDIVPDKRQQMQATVNKFDSLMKQAEDKRLLQGLEQAQGPSSAVVERMSALRQAKGLSGDFFTSPASSLGAADEFMASRAQKMFNNRFEDLGQSDKNKLIRMLMWRQQNPNATMTDEESMFKKMMKGK